MAFCRTTREKRELTVSIPPVVIRWRCFVSVKRTGNRKSCETSLLVVRYADPVRIDLCRRVVDGFVADSGVRILVQKLLSQEITDKHNTVGVGTDGAVLGSIF
jgi:hypothetical protein